MKNVNDKYLCIAILLFVIALFAVRASAQQFVFKGVYNVQDVIINYCDDCFLQRFGPKFSVLTQIQVPTDSPRTSL